MYESNILYSGLSVLLIVLIAIGSVGIKNALKRYAIGK